MEIHMIDSQLRDHTQQRPRVGPKRKEETGGRLKSDDLIRLDPSSPLGLAAFSFCCYGSSLSRPFCPVYISTPSIGKPGPSGQGRQRSRRPCAPSPLRLPPLASSSLSRSHHHRRRSRQHTELTSLTVPNTGRPRWVVPAFLGLTPPTILVP